jgi:hypothetical protein
MKIFDSISPSDRPDKCLFVEISDLVAADIAGGGALASVEATAIAYGGSTYAGTNATTQARSFQKVSIAWGWGSAVAVGDYTAANVQVYGVGDKVIQQSQTYNFANRTVATGYVFAIGYP